MTVYNENGKKVLIVDATDNILFIALMEAKNEGSPIYRLIDEELSRRG